MIDPVATTAPAATGAASGLGSLGGDAFLNLLVAQLRYQNPMAPSDPSSMLQQTATFTQVETIQRLAAAQQQLLGLSRATMAADMVGRDITALRPDGTEITGVVDGVRFSPTGPVLLVGDEEVAVDAVTGFSTPAVAPSGDEGTATNSPS